MIFPRPIRVSLTKNFFDNDGKKIKGVILISCVELNFHQLVIMLLEFPFVGLDTYPLYSKYPSEKFRMVKATSGPARIDTFLCEFVLTHHGDPKYWKWALIASGLVRK
jgi:hypothetical protein